MKTTLYDGTVYETPELEGEPDRETARFHRTEVREVLISTGQARLLER